MAENKPGLGTARIAGRIFSVRRVTGKDGAVFVNLINLPAPDQYTRPGMVEVLSGERIGSAGDEVSILVNIGGYRRQITPKDPEQRPYDAANNVLRFAGVA